MRRGTVHRSSSSNLPPRNRNRSSQNTFWMQCLFLVQFSVFCSSMLVYVLVLILSQCELGEVSADIHWWGPHQLSPQVSVENCLRQAKSYAFALPMQNFTHFSRQRYALCAIGTMKDWRSFHVFVSLSFSALCFARKKARGSCTVIPEKWQI